MKLSTACVLGMTGSILFCISSIIGIIAIASYLEPIMMFARLLPVGGWILITVFFAVLKQKSKKIDKVLEDL